MMGLFDRSLKFDVKFKDRGEEQTVRVDTGKGLLYRKDEGYTLMDEILLKVRVKYPYHIEEDSIISITVV